MTPFESIQIATYSKAEERAKDRLNNWPETVLKLTNEGYSHRQIARIRREVELNAKGVFR